MLEELRRKIRNGLRGRIEGDRVVLFNEILEREARALGYGTDAPAYCTDPDCPEFGVEHGHSTAMPPRPMMRPRIRWIPNA